MSAPLRSLLVVALLPAGCAAPLALHQQGRVVRQGDLRLGGAVGLGLSTSALDLLEAADEARKGFAAAVESAGCQGADGSAVDCVPLDEYRPFVRAGLVALVASPVVPYWAAEARYGLAERLDAGVRYTVGTVRADAAFQLFGPTDGSPGASATLGLAWTHHLAALPVPDVLESVSLDDFGREDFDVPLVVGYKVGEWALLAAGVRYLASRWRIDLRPDVPPWVQATGGPAGDRVLLDGLPDTDEAGWVHHLGGMVAAYVGYEHVYVGAELTVTGYAFEARVLGESFDERGLTLFPSLAVFAEL